MRIRHESISVDWLILHSPSNYLTSCSTESSAALQPLSAALRALKQALTHIALPYMPPQGGGTHCACCSWGVCPPLLLLSVPAASWQYHLHHRPLPWS